MIAHVRGAVAAVSLNSAVLDLQGVGYHVMCTPSTIADLRLGQEATLWTSMVVREDSMTLYGFANAEERDMFELVQTASGVGPKVAQAMLAVLPPERLRTAIASSDHATLTKVPGIGRKGAERIVVELKDRVGAVASSAVSTAGPAWRDQVHEALVGLGWSAKDADAAIDRVADGVGPDPDISAILRDALRSMDRGR
ncbi:Holliday junction branch migration protein RuvA [Aeromicrobium sp. Marseille-Q0843]|uniref:Holliday junction branch migration complex subunit RuvA n=1 Tax=Aeromicrobium phoceense TaxID=2754045 RepID=A0A838XJZ4_9ACTN|nr:Holliday junction branch migration protein RuvA [Aeromicrobium phoceense]MBA4609321.1 Holliday junction branch migration protein RuvA [Aeromicrobium phoceense]